MEWQPIETAPRPACEWNTHSLTLCYVDSNPDKSIVAIGFYESPKCPFIDYVAGHEGGFWDIEANFFRPYKKWKQPTHWMPLPSSDSPDWQPIETAPKDDLIILGCFRTGLDEDGDEYESIVTHGSYVEDLSVFCDGEEVGGFLDCDCQEFGQECQPTHWMPLPAPPREGSQHE